MGLNLKELFDNIEFKGNSSKIILKWVLGIIGVLLVFAFMFGQYKTNLILRLKRIENNTNRNYELIKKVNNNLRNNTKYLDNKIDETYFLLDNKIDKAYVDGIKVLDEYKNFNNKQLKLIIDYNQTNKELLKKIIDLNSEEYQLQVKKEMMETIKNDSLKKIKKDTSFVIGIKPIKKKKQKNQDEL